CGMLAIELPKDKIEYLFGKYSGKETEIDIDVNSGSFTIISGGVSEKISFEIDGFSKALVEAEGWVGYADKKY
nr:3-isopropylmalate dehydratase small subunit [Spirochaetota bacterium]